jgi:hypothetical protein
VAGDGSERDEHVPYLALGPWQTLDAQDDRWVRCGRQPVAPAEGRVLAPGSQASLPAGIEPFRWKRHGRHELDAYFYHHTGTNALRCLALSNRGGLYEGDLTVLDGGALQLDLKGYEGDRVVSHVARFDFEQDGTLRHRVWSLHGTERTLMLDVHHKELGQHQAPPDS